MQYSIGTAFGHFFALLCAAFEPFYAALWTDFSFFFLGPDSQYLDCADHINPLLTLLDESLERGSEVLSL